MTTWSELEPEFRRDGSLRDIFVLNTDSSDWQRALDALRASGFEYQYFRAGRAEPLPRLSSDAFPRPGASDRRLRIEPDGFAAHCHFFTEEEIEFDLDPGEIRGQRQLDGILRFMRLLSEATGKDAILTPENRRECAILRVQPGSPIAHYQPSGLYS